eukprot:6472933-Amphidinium_carterae.2
MDRLLLALRTSRHDHANTTSSILKVERYLRSGGCCGRTTVRVPQGMSNLDTEPSHLHPSKTTKHWQRLRHDTSATMTVPVGSVISHAGWRHTHRALVWMAHVHSREGTS